MASKTAVFFLLLALWGILDIKAASVTSYKKDTWVDRLAGLVSSFIFQILSLHYHGWCTRISLALKYSFHVLLQQMIRTDKSAIHILKIISFFNRSDRQLQKNRSYFHISVRTRTAQPRMKYMYFTNVNNMPNAVKPSFLTYKFNTHFTS